MVRATLTCMKEILGSGKAYDFINLMSESDYPLVPASTVHQFLAHHIGNTFMEFERTGSDWWNEAQQKINRYHPVDWHFPGKHRLADILTFLTPERRLPLNMEFVGRSQWFTIAVEHVHYLLGQLEAHPSIERFFKYTWGPDEFFFHTLLFNSPFREKIINDNLRYIDWGEGKPSPKLLTSADYGLLEQSKKFYARKFDNQVDPVILDLLDRLSKTR